MVKVSLVGNPNTGKTTLYNRLTGANEHVGNWHGVTVEERAKIYDFKGEKFRLVDLPGIYSLTSLSYEEEVATTYILKNPDDIVINICDASNLQRNLYLTLCLLEFGAKVILAINQIEKHKICQIDVKKLQKMLKIPVILINPEKNEGIDELNNAILKYKYQKSGLKYIKSLNLQPAKAFLKQNNDFLAIKLLENDEKVLNFFNFDIPAWKNDNKNIEKIVSLRYQFIDEIISDCTSKRAHVYGQSKADKILLNRFLALPIFVCIMAGVFYLTFFSVGRFLSDIFVYLLENCITKPILSLFKGLPPGLLSFFENGVFGGASMVLGFLPQVALLFLFLSVLEDSGYLSRIAFLADDVLSKVGLSGKSIYTLLMGFGCSTTAVLTARNMENKNSKIKTALLTPYMSCSAKFPIYATIGGVFFGVNNIWVILGLYFLGAVVSVFLSFLFEKTILKSKSQTFILEFPPYHEMSARRVAKLLWKNVKDFLMRVGTLIISMNVIVWVLSNFSFGFKYVEGGAGSILESLGKVLSPIFKPLGFSSWGLVSALLAGLIAKEVIVSSIYLFSGAANESALALAFSAAGGAVFFAGKAAVLSYLVFCLLYFPCLANVGTLSKEIGKKWTAVGCVIQLLTAYLVAFVTYRLSLLGWLAAIVLVLAVAIIATSTICICKLIKRKNCPQCAGCNKRCKKF